MGFLAFRFRDLGFRISGSLGLRVQGQRLPSSKALSPQPQDTAFGYHYLKDHVSMRVSILYMGVDQNYGPPFGPLNYKEYTITQTPKRAHNFDQPPYDFITPIEGLIA